MHIYTVQHQITTYLHSLPKKTIDAIKQSAERYEATQPVFETDQTDELLSTLDNDAGDACARLDANAFVVVIQALLSAERCRSGERGMYLLAVSIIAIHDSSARTKLHRLPFTTNM